MAKQKKSAPKGETPAKLVVDDLPNGRDFAFEVVFDAGQLRAGAKLLDVISIDKVRIKGTLSPRNRADWVLEAGIGASVIQACVVTLQPVKTRIEDTVHRNFIANWTEPEADSVSEMDEDVDSEPLGAEIDLEKIALEAISLAMPDYPRVADAELGEAVFTQKGVAAMTDDDAKPFAGLAALKDKLDK